MSSRIEVRLATDTAVVAAARSLAHDYMRIWYFDEEPLDGGDQNVLDEFVDTYGPARRGTAWVAYIDDRPVGGVLLDEKRRPEGRTLDMHRLFVRQGHRRIGVATALVDAVIRHGQVQASPLRAMVPTRRSDALDLLLGRGFERTDTTTNANFIEVRCAVPQADPKIRFAMPRWANVTHTHVQALLDGADALLIDEARRSENHRRG